MSEHNKQQFDGTVQVGERNRVFIALPFDPQAVWGQKARHHIRGTINGRMIRGPLDNEGPDYYIMLGPAWRRDSGIGAGDRVSVTIEAEGPQQDSLAADIVSALAAEPDAREFFDALATFYRKGYLKWLDGARKPEARAARIQEMIALLKAKKKQRA